MLIGLRTTGPRSKVEKTKGFGGEVEWFVLEVFTKKSIRDK